MAAKRFLFVSLGILALAVAFHMGAENARGSIQEIAAAYLTDESYMSHAITIDGDVYAIRRPYGPYGFSSTLIGNVFTGPVATEKTSWGGVKKAFK